MRSRKGPGGYAPNPGETEGESGRASPPPGYTSVSHLLQVIETLEERSAHFRSLRDSIGASTSQGMLSLQVRRRPA